MRWRKFVSGCEALICGVVKRLLRWATLSSALCRGTEAAGYILLELDVEISRFRLYQEYF